MANLDFDAAVAVLRKIYLEGEALPRLAHATGRPTARMATELRDLLKELDRAVQVAARSEGRRTIHLAAREGVIAGQHEPRTIALDAHGEVIDLADLWPCEREALS